MSIISRGLSLTFATVLLSVPMQADNGTLLHLVKGSQRTTKTVPTSSVITFTPRGLLISSFTDVITFGSFDTIELGADRSAVTPPQGGGSTTPEGNTTVSIAVPSTAYAEIQDLGPSEVTPPDTTDTPDDSTPPVTEVYDLGNSIITVRGTYVYTGSPIIPTFTVTYGDRTLTEGVDYVTEYYYNDQVGRAFISIKAVSGSNYEGGNLQEFLISANDLGEATVTLSKSRFSSTGTALEPTVTVKLGTVTLKKGVDYEVSYSNNFDPGTATVTIRGEGNYTGTVTKTFVIEKQEFVLSIDGVVGRAETSSDGNIALFRSANGVAWITGYSAASGDSVTLSVQVQKEGYVIGSVQFTGVSDYKEAPGMNDIMTYKYVKPAGALSVAIVFAVDPGTGIRDAEASGVRFQLVDGNTVLVTGAEETAKVGVYDVRGQQVAADVERSADVLVVRLDGHPQGLYIIKVNNNTFKIYKK